MPRFRDILRKENNLRLYIDPSTYCNAGCPQCDRTDHKSGGLRKFDWIPNRMWTPERIKRVYPPDLPVYEVFICGTYGDPFMVKGIEEMIYYFLGNGWRVTVNTNGGTHDDFYWYELGARVRENSHRDNPKMRVVFDVDGTTNEMHAKYRRFVDLGLVLSHMEAFVMGGGFAETHTIVFEHNQHALREIKEMCRERGATTCLFQKSNRAFFNDDGQEFRFYNENNEQETLRRSNVDLRQASS